MWAWQIVSITANNDKLTYTLVYQLLNDGVLVDTKTEPLVSATPPEDIKIVCVRICDNEANYRNRIDAQKAAIEAADVAVLVGHQDDVKAALGVSVPDPMSIPETQLTDEQQATNAFYGLVSEYRTALFAESLGLKLDRNTDTIKAEIQKNFKPEFLDILAALRV